ncbi:MAG: hypothetical protein ABIR63_08695 [Sphingomicrobium sp.]
MKARTIARIEFEIETVAAASAAAAVGYAVTVLVTGHYPYPVVPGMAAGAIAFTAIREALKWLAPPVLLAKGVRSLPFPALSLADFKAVGAPVPQASAGFPAEEPLLLEDALAELTPDQRVVQLFDYEGQPSSEESRIDSEAGNEAPGKRRGSLR